MTDQEQEYKSIPVAAARAAVQASGELAGLKGPEFWQADRLTDKVGGLWLPMFVATDDNPHPAFARVIITRKDQEPREVVISWAEYEAEIETEQEQAWADGRRLKPMSIFGAEVERHAYRVAFADVLAAAFPPRVREDHRYGDADPHAEVTQAWEPARDWIGEVKSADAVKLNALYDEAREAGALVKVDGLQLAFTNRMLDLATAPKPTPAPRPKTSDVVTPSGNRRRRGKR